MRRHPLLCLALGLLTLGVPAAHASDVTADCAFNSVALETVTGGGDTRYGVAYGYATSYTPGASISVWCEVRVNGGTVASTPAGAAGQFSTTAGQVTFSAANTDVIDICAVWTGSESGDSCPVDIGHPLPGQEFWDLVNAVLAIVEDLPGASPENA